MDGKQKKHIKAPTILVIFGATGDLAQRKLISALLDLSVQGHLPEVFYIVGYSRRAYSNEEYRAFVSKAIKRKKHSHTKKQVDLFLSRISYCQGTFDDFDGYNKLSSHINALDNEIGQCANKLYYLAVPPSFYEIILKHIAASGLTALCDPVHGWTRVLVEKPFGRDVATAKKLDKTLSELFQEEQIFRIDHYLAKETTQNILMFRFSNELFEPLWNHHHIDRVEITLFEKLGLEGRVTFYDGVGALRDVGQNHMLQMLAAVAMENPEALEARAIRRERAKVFKSLSIPQRGTWSDHVVRGQYRGYRREKGIAPHSTTETYFRIAAEINNERWKGVPFILESGKKMKETKTEITIYFKSLAACLCSSQEQHQHQNVLTFRIQPHEGIHVRFWVKAPGFVEKLEPKNLSFFYSQTVRGKKLPDAYERILYDCLRGDQTLFASTEEVLASWRFVTPILKKWKKTKLYIYQQGSRGL